MEEAYWPRQGDIRSVQIEHLAAHAAQAVNGADGCCTGAVDNTTAGVAEGAVAGTLGWGRRHNVII